MYHPFNEEDLNCLINPHISSPFVFLETASFNPGNEKSLLFSSFCDFLLFYPGDNLDSFFRKMEDYLQMGFWLSGFFSYEFGYFLEPSLSEFRPEYTNSPLVWLGVCREPLIFYHKDHNKSRKKIKGHSSHCELKNLGPSLNETEYYSGIRNIKRQIEEGQTYQVNFTFKYKFDFQGSILDFYLNLRRAQPTSYMAFLNTGKEYILSLSPELFFHLKKDQIKVRPMKGTLSRGYLLNEDEERIHWLKNDIKNRAENVMIVDLMRNDLGRISKTGTVVVEELFEVEKYRTLHQMVSTIKSSLKKGISFKEIFQALFPSGSVTGAPKISTMKIIAELEKESRHIYTGAIGYISPHREASFNVAIRTILIREGKGEMGVGGGIVYDSWQDQEYKEAHLKAHFLTQKFPQFSLIESIRWEREKGFHLLDLHLNRLTNSARYFQIPLDLEEVKKRLAALETKLRKEWYKVRVLVNLEGEIEINYQPLGETILPVKVKLSRKRIDPTNLFLYHKTTYRHLYDREKSLANKEGFFEVIFINSRGELTEGAISNIFLLIQDKLFTPSLTCGLLPGVLRQHLLEKGEVSERVLYLDDILPAQKVFIGNSVRGLLEVEICLPSLKKEYQETRYKAQAQIEAIETA
ncbi:MAG TPA: aminodeoxychorismate synthase component I [bacterium]|nr:aminodeoxychorismate synthase component I [bacterium]